MPTASSSTAAVPSLHPHQRSAPSSHHAAADKKASSPFSMMVDAVTVPDQPPRPDAPPRDSVPRDTDVPPSRDQAASANASDRQAAPADKPANQTADQPADQPAETAVDVSGQPVVATGGAGTPETAPTEDADALLAEATEQTTAVDQTAGESEANAIAAASVSPTPAPPSPPIPPAAAIAIPIVTADAAAPTDSAGSDQIAAVTGGAPPAAATPVGPQQPAKPELSPLSGRPGDGKASDKAGESANDAKGPVQAAGDQPGASNNGKAASAPATPTSEAATAAADGDKATDVPRYAGAEEASQQAAEPADTTRAPERPAAASDNRLSNLHLLSTSTRHETLQAVGATAAGMPAAATGQIANQNAVSAAVPISSIPVEIAARAQAGSNRFEIRLDPPELGRIDVRLDVDRNGNVTSRLIADRGDTLDLLRREAPQLERALQDAGLKTGDNGLQFSLRDQGPGTDRNTRENPATATPKADASEPEPLPVEALRSYRWSGGTGGVDIRV